MFKGFPYKTIINKSYSFDNPSDKFMGYLHEVLSIYSTQLNAILNQLQVASLFLLFCAVLMVTVPLHVMSLAEYLITIQQFNLSLSIQEIVLSFLNRILVTDVGSVLVGVSSCFLVPSSLGYVGAVRESRLLLFLVT